jgi:hypothetical protein
MDNLHSNCRNFGGWCSRAYVPKEIQNQHRKRMEDEEEL